MMVDFPLSPWTGQCWDFKFYCSLALARTPLLLLMPALFFSDLGIVLKILGFAAAPPEPAADVRPAQGQLGSWAGFYSALCTHKHSSFQDAQARAV